jgi:hypothetical protein
LTDVDPPIEAEPAQQAERMPKMTIAIPYMNAYGVITKALEKIKTATTPDRFTQDFLSTKLGLPGGTPKPVIPFLKRTGFLNGDGAPTELYKAFRNERTSGSAAASALKRGFAPLYEINEYAHDLDDKDLKGVIVQATGLESKAKTVGAIVGTFNALKAFANFDEVPELPDLGHHESTQPSGTASGSVQLRTAVDLKLGYTINLNLPASTDIAVFNAIFKSLRENLLD